MNRLQALEAFRGLPKDFEREYRDFEIDPHIIDLGRVINAVDGMKSSESCQGHLFSISFPLAWREYADYANLNEAIARKINEHHKKVQKPLAYFTGGFFYFSAVPTGLSEKIVGRINDFCRTNNSLEFIEHSSSGLGERLINFRNYPVEDGYFDCLGRKERVELSGHIKDYAIFVRDFDEAKELELGEIAKKQFFLNEDKAIEIQKNVLNSWSRLAKEITNLVPGLELALEIGDYGSYYWKHRFNNSGRAGAKTSEINVGLLI